MSDTDNMVEIPEKHLAELAKKRVLLDGDIRMDSEKEPAWKDKWDIIEESTLKYVEYLHNDKHHKGDTTVHAMFETDVTIQRHYNNATKYQPADYENIPHRADVSIDFDLTEPELPTTCEIYIYPKP